MRDFLMGNHILALAAKQAGAKIMYGYPITPATETLEYWAKLALKDKTLKYLQVEDEMAAGFGVIGSCFVGVPAFTATAGPGTILMQDAFSMAEALRIPTVAMIMQRGGLSTSTVIYSQEEVRLTCFGGNGEGFRLVYSTANLQELFDYTLKAFQVAWKYRFPTFILADGYQGKMMGEVEIREAEVKLENVKPILHKGVNLRNCFNQEEEIATIIKTYEEEYTRIRGQIEEAEIYQDQDAEILLIAHGIVAAAAKMAVDQLRKEGLKVGLFRPVTLRPFPISAAQNLIQKVKIIISIESSLGQMAELLKRETVNLGNLIEVNKPALGFTPEEIVHNVKGLI